MGARGPAGVPSYVPRPTAWWRLLAGGLGLYLAGLGIMASTGNPILFPTVVGIGNFLIPVVYVTFWYEHRILSRLTLPLLGLALFYGGVIGVLAAALLEPLFIRRLDFVTAFEVGIIEEFVKVVGVIAIGRQMARQRRALLELDGLILGAAAGMGFAALESMGYTFTAFLRSGGSLSAFVGVTMLRGVLSPLGHGTWSAIVGAALFRYARAGEMMRVSGPIAGAYAVAVLLHGLWDGLPGLVTDVLGPGPDVAVAQLTVGAAGLWVLRQRWVGARRDAIRGLSSPGSPPEPETAALGGGRAT